VQKFDLLLVSKFSEMTTGLDSVDIDFSRTPLGGRPTVLSQTPSWWGCGFGPRCVVLQPPPPEITPCYGLAGMGCWSSGDIVRTLHVTGGCTWKMNKVDRRNANSLSLSESDRSVCRSRTQCVSHRQSHAFLSSAVDG